MLDSTRTFLGSDGLGEERYVTGDQLLVRHSEEISGANLSEFEKELIREAIIFQDVLHDLATVLFNVFPDQPPDEAVKVYNRVKKYTTKLFDLHTKSNKPFLDGEKSLSVLYESFIQSTSNSSFNNNTYSAPLIMLCMTIKELDSKADMSDEDRAKKLISEILDGSFAYAGKIFHIHAIMVMPHFIRWVWHRMPRLTSYAVVSGMSTRYKKIIAEEADSR